MAQLGCKAARADELPCCRAAANKTSTYTSPVTGSTYILNTTLGDRYSAQAGCRKAGGHLVSFTSLEEQMDVEQVCWGWPSFGL